MSLKSLSPRDVPLKAMPPIQRFYNLLKQSHQAEDQVFKHWASGGWYTIYNTSALSPNKVHTRKKQWDDYYDIEWTDGRKSPRKCAWKKSPNSSCSIVHEFLSISEEPPSFNVFLGYYAVRFLQCAFYCETHQYLEPTISPFLQDIAF